MTELLNFPGILQLRELSLLGIPPWYTSLGWKSGRHMKSPYGLTTAFRGIAMLVKTILYYN